MTGSMVSGSIFEAMAGSVRRAVVTLQDPPPRITAMIRAESRTQPIISTTIQPFFFLAGAGG